MLWQPLSGLRPKLLVLCSTHTRPLLEPKQMATDLSAACTAAAPLTKVATVEVDGRRSDSGNVHTYISVEQVLSHTWQQRDVAARGAESV